MSNIKKLYRNGVNVYYCHRCSWDYKNVKDGNDYKLKRVLMCREWDVNVEECEVRDNCLYKQLKRLEKKYASLKRKYQTLSKV